MIFGRLRTSAEAETLYSRIPCGLARRLKLSARWWGALFNLLIFGLPLWGVFFCGFFTSFDREKLGPLLSISILIASIWIWLGPLLIFLWEGGYHNFLRMVVARLRRQPVYDRRFKPLIKVHRKRARWWGCALAVFTLWFFWNSTDVIRPFTTMYERPEVYWATVFVLTASGYATGYGVSGVVQFLRLFWTVDVLRLEWMPFHHDGRGGYGFLGSFTLITAICFAGGVVVLPAAYGIARQVTNVWIYGVWAAAIAYTLLIAIVVAYPMIKLFMIAEREKERELRLLGSKLTNLYRVAVRCDEKAPSPRELQALEVFENLRSLESKIREVSAIPFSKSVRLGMIPTILSPLFSLGFGKAVELGLPDPLHLVKKAAAIGLSLPVL